MPFLIDGYNLLHASGVFGRGTGTLEDARCALLNFLTIHLAADDLSYTTIIFDAKDAPPGLPETYLTQGMTVRFAKGYPDADSLLEELIAADDAARRLTVVSSDHRVQRAARKRRATAIDSDLWCSQLVSLRLQRRLGQDSGSSEDEATPTSDDVEWQEYFQGIDAEAIMLEEGIGIPDSAVSDKRFPPPAEKRKKQNRVDDDELGMDNPFPPEYLDDLMDEL